MPDTPAGDAYRGPCGIARDSTWLTSEDLPADRDVTVTVDCVVIRRKLTMQGGREKPIGLSLRFVKRERELLLNATNRKALSALYGSDTAAWFGRPVILYVEQDVRRPDGTHGPAVRIRCNDEARKLAKASKAQPVTVPPAREAGAEG